MKIYIYSRLRPLLILPIFLLLSAGSYLTDNNRAHVEGDLKDSSFVFTNNNITIMPGETLSCNSLKELDVVFWLPPNVQDKYGKVKFYLYVDNKEYKTRDFTVNDLQGQMANQRAWKLIAITGDKKKHSDFDNVKTDFLDLFNLCTVYSDTQLKGYTLKVEAKGYKQTGTDKNGKPKFLKQEVFASGKIYVSTSGQAMK